MPGEWIVNGFDITDYAPPPHGQIVVRIAEYIERHLLDPCAANITKYIQFRAPDSPLTGEMFLASCENHNLRSEGLNLLMALIQQDSMYGTKGEGADLHNPGNVGDDDAGHTRDYGTWQNGVDAVAEWMNQHRSA